MDDQDVAPFIDGIIERMNLRRTVSFTHEPGSLNIVFRANGEGFAIWGYQTDSLPSCPDHPLAIAETRVRGDLLPLPGGMLGRGSFDTIQGLLPLERHPELGWYVWPSMTQNECIRPEGFTLVLTGWKLGTPECADEVQRILEAALGLNGRWLGIAYY